MNHRTELMQQTMPGLVRLIHGFKNLFGAPGQMGEITMLQTQVLGLLYINPNSTAKDIGDTLYLSSSATTQLLQRLVESGWIERKNDAIDRRSIRLSLTTHGKEILHEYRSGKAERVRDIFSVLNDDELQSFILVINKLNNAIQEHKNVSN